ncbi:transcriptional regulator, HxlR family [Streptoalloteichus tenebrarius]|uniref:Transcriptional regulator, HxlR family n=1 Tax=Streptoalloteichus tenebrarius (strain ATCC 17920 / DSM 40477 / JCM 4838 / CBS 697.72 / NBRC 16177 / NCIMB 11028 / NRRL B-12390 / A12253. 1 / ISP 5477) TaxID=1933 RepID=A0ABT1HPR8_STRSD|nr:helix-turn-helix domain-containing protein [Streptoalloteichus tenebrarius]MCP2257507.1 transcriptional regulator, HxlR family [Streptoalloteichus tenebrarius]
MARDDAAGRNLAWTDPNCPVARAVDVVGDRWSLLIIRDAMDGARSFTDFQQRTGIARNILADRLRKLVAHGLIAQVEAPTGKRRVYALTPAGKDLFPVIVTLRQWGERHAYDAGETHSVLVDDHGAVVPPVVPVAADGRPLTSDTTTVRKPA